MASVKPYARLGVCLLAAMLLGGCGSGYTAINGRDDGVFFPALRLALPIHDQDNLHGKSDDAVEFELSRGAGEGRQSLASSEIISLNGTTFSGPTDIRQNYTLTAAQLLLRFRFPRKARIFAEVLGGFRATNLGLTLRSSSASAQDDLRNLSPAVGIGAGARLADYLTLDLRFVADLNNDGGLLRSRDLDLSFWISPFAAIRAGYRQWRYDKRENGESAINRLAWSGFTGGLVFSF